MRAVLNAIRQQYRAVSHYLKSNSAVEAGIALILAIVWYKHGYLNALALVVPSQSALFLMNTIAYRQLPVKTALQQPANPLVLVVTAAVGVVSFSLGLSAYFSFIAALNLYSIVNTVKLHHTLQQVAIKNKPKEPENPKVPEEPQIPAENKVLAPAEPQVPAASQVPAPVEPKALQPAPVADFTQKMVTRVQAAIEKSCTPHRYQALANMLHYAAGVPQQGMVAPSEPLIDNAKMYGEGYFNPFLGSIFNEKIPEQFKKINQEKNILALVQWAQGVAMQKSVERIVKKFKIVNPQIQNHIQDILRKLYYQQDIFEKALGELKLILISARIKKNAPEAYDVNGKEIEKILIEYICNNNSYDQAVNNLRPLLPHVDVEKLIRILTKFPILRKITTPEQVADKIEDEVYGVIHSRFAQEIEALNNIERITFQGDETLYRGIPKHAISEEYWQQHFEMHHRAISAAGDLCAYQIKTKWNYVVHPVVGNVGSNATAASADLRIALKYAFDKNNPNKQFSTEGWVVEIRPKKGQTAVTLADYEPRGVRYSEVDFAQIETTEIFAVHLVKTVKQGKVEVVKSLHNPYYKKRDSDVGVENGLATGAEITWDQGYDQNAVVPLQIKQGNKAVELDVVEAPAYKRFIKNALVKDGALPSNDEVRANRKRIMGNSQ